MPFEVTPVAFDDRDFEKAKKETAAKIAEIYADTEDRNGSVIAGHTIRGRIFGNEILFLVSKFPE